MPETLPGNTFNISLVLQLAPFVFYAFSQTLFKVYKHREASLIRKIEESYYDSNDEEELDEVSKTIRKIFVLKEKSLQLLMYFAVFNIANLVNIAIVYFGSGSSGSAVDFAILGLGVATLVGTFAIFLVDPAPFDYFRYSFIKTTLAMMHYFMYPLAVLLTAVLMVLVPDYPFLALLPLLPLIVYTLHYKPYSEHR